MKKFFTILAAAAVSLSLSAVELNVTTPTGTILPSGNILFNNPDPDLLQEGEVFIIGKVDVSSDVSVAAEVSATLSSGVEKYGVCIGTCVPVSVGQTISRNVTIAPGSPIEISVEPMLTAEPWTSDVVRTYVVDVRIASGNETLKTFSIIVSNDENASVGVVGTDEEAFKVSGRYISWNLPEAPGVMTVYTIDGRVVEQMRLSTPSGSKALVLPAGIYVWATPSGSGKICIRN